MRMLVPNCSVIIYSGIRKRIAPNLVHPERATMRAIIRHISEHNPCLNDLKLALENLTKIANHLCERPTLIVISGGIAGLHHERVVGAFGMGVEHVEDHGSGARGALTEADVLQLAIFRKVP